MRFLTLTPLVFLLALLVRAEPAPPELSDSWVIQTLTRSGTVDSDATGKVIIIRGSEMTSDLDPGRVSMIAVDPAKDPPWFDITDGEQPAKKGIYLLEGDKLTICVAEMDMERPRKFASPTGSSATLIELTRKPHME